MCSGAAELSPAHTSNCSGSTTQCFFAGLRMEFGGTQREIQTLVFARCQCHPIEAFQLSDWTRSTPRPLVNVNLSDHIAFASSRIGDV